MKKTRTINQTIDQIMKDLKKSNLPQLMIDTYIARIKKRIAEWENRRDNAGTPEQLASFEESIEICKMNLETTIQEKKEIVDATLGLIRLAVRRVIETICWRYEHMPLYKCQNDSIVLITSRQPFDEEAIKKFGNGISFSIPIKEGTFQNFRISKLEPRRGRRRKRENFVTVYFQKV